MLRIAACIAAGAALAACQSIDLQIPSKKLDYKSAGKLPVLEVPQDLTPPPSDNVFAIPQPGKPQGPAAAAASASGAAGTAAATSARPVAGNSPNASANAAANAGPPAVQPAPSTQMAMAVPAQRLRGMPENVDVRVERAGAERWLVVNLDAATAWQWTKDFWQDSGLGLKLELPEAGVMETVWAENRGNVPSGWLGYLHSTDTRDKFRCRLERSPSGGTEIHVTHYGLLEVYITPDKDQTRWQPRKAEPGLELEMMRRMMVRFGVQPDRIKQLMAEASGGGSRASLATTDGSALTVNEDFSLAWRRVGLALDRVGYAVIGRDRTKGIYTVRYLDPSSEVVAGSDGKGMVGKVLGKLNPFNSAPKSGEQFRVAVRGKSTVSQVNVVDRDGRDERSAAADHILALLYAELR